METKTNSPASVITPLADALLNLGKVIYDAAGHRSYRPSGAGRNQIQDATTAAMAVIRQSKEAANIIAFHGNGEPDMVEVQVLGATTYAALMLDYHPYVRLISELVGKEVPRDVMLARVVIRRLCERHILNFRNGTDGKPWNGRIALTPKALTALGFCIERSPIFGEKTLAGSVPALDGDTDADAAPVETHAPKESIPPACVLYTRIRQQVKGGYVSLLPQAERTVSALPILSVEECVHLGRHRCRHWISL
jgi:hypothetical protein